MTHRDGLPRFSARSVRRGDPGSAGGFAEASAVYREASATLSETWGRIRAMRPNIRFWLRNASSVPSRQEGGPSSSTLRWACQVVRANTLIAHAGLCAMGEEQA